MTVFAFLHLYAGTWQGPGWNSEHSTLLQVLVSIQSLILGVSEPWYNEPGTEHDRASEKESQQYNADIRGQTARYAIIDAMRKPSHVFRDIIIKHYYYKRSVIMSQLKEWSQTSLRTNHV